MARQHAATHSEDKYARLMGSLQMIDHEVEPIIGVVTIIDKQLEIESRKRKMLAEDKGARGSMMSGWLASWRLIRT